MKNHPFFDVLLKLTGEEIRQNKRKISFLLYL